VYQSAVIPDPVETVRTGNGIFVHTFLFPPLTGAGGTGLMVSETAVRVMLTHPVEIFLASA
jgi:hypothetical protein